MSDIAWLDALEVKVHEAASRLRDLRQENQELTLRISDLEERLAAAVRSDPDPDAAGWKQERAEIRRRVENLSAQLEQLRAG